MRMRLIERRLSLDPPLSREALAHKVGIHPKSLAKIEQGKAQPRPGTRVRLSKALGWSVAELAVALSDEAQNGVAGHVVPSTLTMLASLEQAASELRWWETYVVPGLLQTAEYAAAVESVGPNPATPEEVARRVELRLSRQRVLDRQPNPLRLFALIDASVLHRTTGGAEVMAAQLDHLRAMAERPNVDIRVVPLDGRAHAAGRGGFTLLTADERPTPFMACTEDLGGVRYHESPSLVEAYAALFAHVWEEADELASEQLQQHERQLRGDRRDG